MIGIYKIINTSNNKIYIGSSSNLKKRKSNHFHYLKNNKHPNKHLQSSYNKYGNEYFIFEIIEECIIKDLILKEQHYIDKLNPDYNKRIIANNNSGTKFSLEAKKNMSLAMKGKGNNFYGRNHSKEAKILMSLAKFGKPSKKSIFPGKCIHQYTLNYRYIKSYDTLKEAANLNNLNYKWFIETIKKNPEHKNYLWYYEKI